MIAESVLAATGFAAAPWIIAAVVLMLIGAALLLTGRRHKSKTKSPSDQ
jgi:LPXTG-motif cell wall-anchored protein